MVWGGAEGSRELQVQDLKGLHNDIGLSAEGGRSPRRTGSE